VRFHETFRSAGFRWKSFYPVYGLAESTLLVASGGRDDEPISCNADTEALARGVLRPASLNAQRATSIVACGPVWSETKVRIVDPETHVPCKAGQIGEIWIASPSVAQGYWRRAEQTEVTFSATLANGDGPWLRTGDLGTLYEGQLLVTGRLKDLLIVRGSKHYPQDLELTSERQHLAIRAGCCAAFTVDGVDGEAIALAAEIDARQLEEGEAPLASIAAAIRRGVVEQHGIQLHAVALLKPGTLPKTTSGKLQRHACRAAFAGRNLDELHRWTHFPLENAS
jgi:acyl-CoA synthetase (AMP-forming)/AMP-acid ligase II